MDSVFYTSIDRRSWINEPTLVRWRSRFRGVRESFKFNQIMNAFLYDIKRLYDLYQSTDEDFTSKTSYLENGTVIESVRNASSTQPTTLGTEVMSRRIQSLIDRVRLLEGNS